MWPRTILVRLALATARLRHPQYLSNNFQFWPYLGPFGPKPGPFGGPEEAKYQVKVSGDHDSNPVRPIGSSWDQTWSPGPSESLRGPQKALLRAPQGLVGPRGTRFGPNCCQLVWLGWNHGYQTLWPGIWPLPGPQGPQKGPFWPQKGLLGAP